MLVFPRIQPFGSDASSSLDRVYSRQATASVNCENSAVSSVMKYCPISTTFRNPASIQNLLNLSCCDNFWIRSRFFCNRRSLWARSSLSKKHTCLDHAWDERGTRLSSHNGFLRSIIKGFICFTHFCDCSVKTELIYRSNCATNSLNRLIVDRQFSTASALELTSGERTRGSEDWVSVFWESQHHLLPLFLWTKTEKWPLSCSKPSCKYWKESIIWLASILLSLLITMRCRWTSTRATHWILLRHSNRVPLAHINSVQGSVFRWTFEPLESLFPRCVWLDVPTYLTKTQHRIWKDVDLCALKTDDLFITKDKYFHE